MEAIILILLFIEFCFHLVNDTRKRRLDIYISHDATVRCVLFLMLSLIDLYLSVFLSCLYLVSFNISFNLLNGKGVNYLSDKSTIDSIILFVKIKPIILYALIIIITFALWGLSFRF